MSGATIVKRMLNTLVSRSTVLSQSRQEVFNNLNQKRLCAFLPMLNRIQFSNDFFFRQLFDEKSWTYSYLMADTNTKEAVIIDPGELVDFSEIWGVYRDLIIYFWKNL